MSSDYTPPNLVKPTPGGNPGDGTINGILTGKSTALMFIWTDAIGQKYGLGRLNVDNSDFAFGDLDSAGLGIDPSNYGFLRFFGAGTYFNASSGHHIHFRIGNGYEFLYSGSSFPKIFGIGTVGLGLAPLYGDDVRTGLTAADSAAKTLYTTTAAGQVYEVAARILGTGGTITSGVYTIGWTEGGVARTATVSVTAAGTLASAVFLLQPDSGTAITAQLTTLSGTSPVANVAAVVKQDV